MSTDTPANNSSRRLFIKRTGLASAGLIFGAPAVLNASTQNAGSDAIKVAFIGCGKQQEVLFNAMKNIPGIHYAAVCDIMNHRLGGAASRIRTAFGNMPNRYTDAEEMLSKETDIDAVIVATPDFWHARHTIWALQAGRHVYCEKMMSNTLEDAYAMVLAAENSGKLCQIGHQRRSNPRYRYALDHLIRGNKICGDITNINGQWNRSVSASQDIDVKESILPDQKTLSQYGYANAHQFLNWRWYRDLSGGPISDLGAHQIDIYNWFLGTTPKSIIASGGRQYFRNREHFDNVMCIFEYDTPWGGTRAFYQVLTTTGAGGGYYESFMGTEGTLQISERAAFTNIYRENSAPLWDDLVDRGYLKRVRDGAAPAPSGGSDVIASYESAAPEKYALPGEMNQPPHFHHLENFFDSIRGKATLTSDARHSFESEAPIYRVDEAAQTHAYIRLNPQNSGL